MSSFNYFKCCMVPMCTNTSIKTPNKVFISVPRNESRRKWLKAVRRDDVNSVALQSRLYCCEDHFDLPNDMENWREYTLMKCKIRMKKNILPHLFDCQPDRKRASTSTTVRKVAVKRQRREILNEIISSEAASTSTGPYYNKEIETAVSEEIVENEIQQHPLRESKVMIDKSVQFKPITCNKYIQCTAHFKNVTTSPLKTKSVDAITSPIKADKTMKKKACTRNLKYDVSSSDDNSSTVSRVSSVAYVTESSDSKKSDYSSDVEKETLEILSKRRTSLVIKRNPRFYLGVPKDCFFIISLLHEELKIPETNIMLCLKKIRLNSTFLELSHDFGMSVSNVSRIFKKCIPLIADNLKPFLLKNIKKSTIKNLPIPFRFRYNRVHSIIDCLEIEIEKPSHPIKQSLSWSDYKKANTLKYLVSCTPDGVINFVSKGYSGRITDALLVEDCEYLDQLDARTEVMADRGFKHVEQLLVRKKCKLIRPPSVFSNIKPTKREVLESKRIASLRIHVERLIRRIREFKFLAPHACIDNHLIPYTDHIIIIAAALINLQGALIKSE